MLLLLEQIKILQDELNSQSLGCHLDGAAGSRSGIVVKIRCVCVVAASSSQTIPSQQTNPVFILPVSLIARIRYLLFGRALLFCILIRLPISEISSLYIKLDICNMRVQAHYVTIVESVQGI